LRACVRACVRACAFGVAAFCVRGRVRAWVERMSPPRCAFCSRLPAVSPIPSACCSMCHTFQDCMGDEGWGMGDGGYVTRECDEQGADQLLILTTHALFLFSLPSGAAMCCQCHARATGRAGQACARVRAWRHGGCMRPRLRHRLLTLCPGGY